ncbi:probable LRR receptor-like serine/threonine-protein kinase At3g47570 [Salvia splendens]|uniref:probable LRR receptor-like serine/threonine-protein kinase At3g47570 n=1 Tax=Salvia splendens TaxID=180675 RepID=UPI001C26A07F|nr:probable LRR receptor-like serine/threonine-protein kinase At3g47570 [Salvia splendens]
MAKPFISNPLIIVLPLFIILTTTPSHSNNHTDLEALLAFKKSIHDDPLHALSSWNETTHFCRWNGVSCSKRHPSRVVSLSLRSLGLVGSLSPHIGNLSFLRIIDLKNNTFNGQIPPEIGRLRRLQVIEFSNNSFGGGIPKNLTHCINLYYLNLIDNELSGDIVREVFSLAKLNHLGLSLNMLSGTIPPEVGNLTDLFILSMSYCGLKGEIPESLSQLRKINTLIFYDNSLTGSIPLGLYNISSLENFAFGSNRLHGNIPPNIGSTLPKLRLLHLYSNHLTGALPASLSNSSLIIDIIVANNSLTGNMIDLTRLSALEKFMVNSNQFNGDISTTLSSLTNCTNLDTLTLNDNHFTGSLPDSIGNLSNHLVFLLFYSNQLSGSIPSSIGNLVGLATLVADGNNLKGPIPSSIGKLHKLQTFILAGNRLTNEIPSSLGNLSLLNSLSLGLNNLSGTIPRSLSNCSTLVYLDLSYNNLSGPIPLEIIKLSSIAIRLDLSENILAGTIPSEVGALINLGIMDLSNNRLSGTIPPSLGSCVMLSALYLGGNSLQGEIPDSLKALRGLQFLDISQNNLSGKIPRFLVEFRLLYLNISFNELQGEVPTLGVFQNESAISLEGNQGLCGGIATLNLPSCPSSPKSKKKGIGKILIPTIVGAICLALAACFCVFIIYKRRTLQNVGAPIFQVPEFLRLSYGELLNATNGFSESTLVGAGRFGSVYKGTINDDDEQTDVAVKVLNLNIRGAYKSLASECNALRGIRHKNLLKIVSVCDSTDFQGNDFKALVYEFMANGSLEDWLHSENEGRGALSAIQRLNIAIDIASAVEYLHFGTDSIVIHGDLKPSNILLDQDMVAKVGDFGLAKIVSTISGSLPSTEGSSSSAIKGTIGYIAPEYGMNYVASTQGDAYSYGVLVLEMFINKRPTSDSFEGCLNLQDFVCTALTDRVMEIVDPFLHQGFNVDEKYWECIVSILSIGVRCSKQLPTDRMSMREVVNDLKKIKKVFPVYKNGRNVASFQH